MSYDMDSADQGGNYLAAWDALEGALSEWAGRLDTETLSWFRNNARFDTFVEAVLSDTWHQRVREEIAYKGE